MVGTFHHGGKQHLQRYLDEFDFRYNARKIQDGERALKGRQDRDLLTGTHAEAPKPA